MKRGSLIIMILIVSVIFMKCAFADIKGFELAIETNYSSIYMWRGIMLDGDPVAQPGIYLKSPEFKFGSFKIGTWFSRPLEDKDALQSTENDYIFEYSLHFADLGLSFGHTYYDFRDLVAPDGSPRGFSKEFYGAISLPKIFLTPSIYYYYDYGRKEEGGGQGSYVVLNLAYSIPFTIRKLAMSFDLSAHAGHNNKLYYRGKGGDAALSIGFSLLPFKNFTARPSLNYSVPWGNVSDKNNGNQKNRVYSSVILSCLF